MKEIIFSLEDISRIKVYSNLDLEDKLDFSDIYSTIPNCSIVKDDNDISAEIELEFVEKNTKQGFYYDETFSKFKIVCSQENYYIPDTTFLMLCVFASKIQEKGYYLIHSSAMNIDGKGVLFVGPSGSGKTNISLYMAKKYAAEYISGDMTLVKFDSCLNKIFLIGGTHSLTAFANIIDSMFYKNCSKDLESINGKKILGKDFLIKNNIKFSKEPVELNLIVNIRGGLKSYIKKNYDKPERIIKVVGMISEWIRTHSNYCISTGEFFPDMDSTTGLELRNVTVQKMSDIPQFSVYGPFDESAKIIYKQLEKKRKNKIKKTNKICNKSYTTKKIKK